MEDRIYELGLEMFADIRREAPSPFNQTWWQNRVLYWCMQHPGFKTELFRFVDELPSLRTDRQIASHLQEHFSRSGSDFPEILRWLASHLPPDSPAVSLISGITRYNVKNLARQFIGAESIREAEPVFRLLRRRGYAFTIDLVGEAAFSMAEADVYHRNYLDALDHLARIRSTWPPLPGVGENAGIEVEDPVNISVKLSSLYPRMNALQEKRVLDALFERMRPILGAARAIGATVYIDMESYPLKNLTLKLFRRIITHPDYKEMAGLGIVIQAYLRDSKEDLEELASVCEKRGVPVWVRLVKGAYWDQEVIQSRQNGWAPPVWLRKGLTDVAYEKLAAFLLDRIDHLAPAFATHNVRTISACMAMAEARGIGPERFEFQTLYGMANPIKEAVVKRGHRMRQYLPVGDLLPGMAYLVRRLLENTANDAFVAQTFLADADPGVLLAAPNPFIPEPAVPLHPFENEPVTPFHLAWGRELWDKAVANLTKDLPVSLRPLAPVRTTGGEVVDRADPSRTDRVLYRAHCMGEEDAKKVVNAAGFGLESWSSLSAGERISVLDRVVPLLREKRWEICARLALEVGKGIDEADAEVAEAVDFITFYCRRYEALVNDPGCRSLPGEANRVFWDPVGVSVVIAPWNFALAIPVGMIAAALVCGNPVIFKPAEQSVWTGLLTGELFHRAGVPKEVLQVVPGRGETLGRALVEHPDTALVAFTGSREVGLFINGACGVTRPGQNHIKRVVCEMGGKNVIYVDADADLDSAMPAILRSAFGYGGQKCSACSIAMVHEGVWERFIERFLPVFADIVQGPAWDTDADLGPLIDADAASRLADWRMRLSGYLLAESRMPDGISGHYVPASVYGPIPLDHELLTTELFGPLLALVPIAGPAEALEWVNRQTFGLTGGVFSRSTGVIELFRSKSRVGNLYINRGITGAIVDRQPFGGAKLSGTGHKAGGREYLRQFMVERAVCENTARQGFAPDMDL